MAIASGAESQGEAIMAYAAEMAGTDLDLNHHLENAGIEHLVKVGAARK